MPKFSTIAALKTYTVSLRQERSTGEKICVGAGEGYEMGVAKAVGKCHISSPPDDPFVEQAEPAIGSNILYARISVNGGTKNHGLMCRLGRLRSPDVEKLNHSSTDPTMVPEHEHGSTNSSSPSPQHILHAVGGDTREPTLSCSCPGARRGTLLLPGLRGGTNMT